jgi:hypothetical protein
VIMEVNDTKAYIISAETSRRIHSGCHTASSLGYVVILNVELCVCHPSYLFIIDLLTEILHGKLVSILDCTAPTCSFPVVLLSL